MRTGRHSGSSAATMPLPGLEDFGEAWNGRRSREADRARRGRDAHTPALSGVVSIAHPEREYTARYELRGELLTVYCGLASNTGQLPAGSPSPKPLAERLLRELIDAEHPGLNPA